jgi:hypothetical protein
MSYRFTGSGTSGKVEGGRTVDSVSVPDEAVFTYAVERTLKDSMRLIRPIVANRQKVLRSDLERLRQMLENSGAAPGLPTTETETRDD